METLIYTGTKYAIYAIGLGGLWMVGSAYFSKTDMKKTIQTLVGVLIFLGCYPFLIDSLPKIGENLVKPIVSTIVNASDDVSKDMNN